MTEKEVLRDLNRIRTDPVVTHKLCTELAMVAMYHPECTCFDAVVSISGEDILIAKEIAAFLNLLLGKEIASFPLNGDLFGEKIEGKRVLLVGEAFHTGHHAERATEAVRDYGGDVACIGAIYSFKRLPHIAVPKICCLASGLAED